MRCPVVERQVALHGVVVARPYCRMGQDYDCRCNYCSDASYAVALSQAESQNAATATARAEVVRVTYALEWLSRIGMAVRAAGGPGLGVSRMIESAGWLRESHGGNLCGFWFLITGKRGAAKSHNGRFGKCVWVGENDSGTVRLGLRINDEDGLVYVTATQCERIPMRADELFAEARAKTEAVVVATAIAPLRPKFGMPSTEKLRKYKKAGLDGPMAYVVSGHHAGKSGRVFWSGPDKKTGEADVRLGIKHQENGVVETLWVSAYDCDASPCVVVDAAERRDIERVAADMAMDGDVEAAREVLASARRTL